MSEQTKTIAQRVLDFIREHHLISPRSSVVVAVSGGADSVCLIHVLDRLKETLGITLHVAHLDHQLRGAESRDDARYVADLARSLGIPATIEPGQVKEYQTEHKTSLEEAAREVRYNFLAQVARSVGAGEVAVGHTSSDHIETILLHLVRGSGTRGLQGLKPKTEWRLTLPPVTIVRPLLPLSREETSRYCEEHRLAPRVDSSNRSRSPLRNRVRLELLPLLQSYNPGVTEALLRTARIAGDDFSFLESTGLKIRDEVVQTEGSTVTLDKGRFLALPPTLQRHLLRMVIEDLLGNLKDIETRHIEIMMSALDKPAGKTLNLPYGLVFSVEYQCYRIAREPAVPSPLPAIEGEWPLNVPGETRLPGWRVEIFAQQKEFFVHWKEGLSEHDEYTAYLDRDRTGDRLTIRNRKTGDRFQPLGMSRPKKLGEFMVDVKIPRARRAGVPIVCSPEQIVWVVGQRIDDRVKVTAETERVLCLKFTPI
jgi:tRNA(Ile)-lysidine synthase